MAYDINGVFTVVYNWATEAASPPIAISKLDTEMAGIATGLSSVYTKTLADARYAALTGATFTGTVTISAAVPYLLLSETGVTANNGKWAFLANGEELSIRAYSDDLGTVSQPMLVTRTATTVDAITFTGTQINLACTGTAVNGDLAVDGAITCTDKGSFTMELATDTTGGSVLASGTAYWKKVGGVVTLRCPALYANTADTSLYLRGIPADIQPSLTGTYTQSICVEGSINGVYGIVAIYVAEGVAYWQIIGVNTGFSSGAADQKGIGTGADRGPTITYQVTD